MGWDRGELECHHVVAQQRRDAIRCARRARVQVERLLSSKDRLDSVEHLREAELLAQLVDVPCDCVRDEAGQPAEERLDVEDRPVAKEDFWSSIRRKRL